MTTRSLKIVILAGEASGDHLGADLMASLRELHAGPIEFHGVGGAAMTASGLSSLFPMTELSIMGVAEILPRMLPLLQRIAQTAAFIQGASPDVVVTIDSPGFNFRVVKKLRPMGIPTVHYVAPQAWGWRPRRARELSHLFDRVLAILPFEPAFFAKYGVDARFVGHPVVARVAGAEAAAEPKAFRQNHGIMENRQVLLALPGSRHSEVKRLLPIFAQTIGLLRDAGANVAVVVPTVAAVEAEVRAHTKTWAMPVTIAATPDAHRDAFAAAHTALAASGTVALELLLRGIPSVITYQLNPITAVMARCLVRVKYASLPNLLCDRMIMPEFLQENCRPELLAKALLPLLDDGPERQEQIGARETVAKLLTGEDDLAPSQRAAAQILDILPKAQRN